MAAGKKSEQKKRDRTEVRKEREKDQGLSLLRPHLVRRIAYRH